MMGSSLRVLMKNTIRGISRKEKVMFITIEAVISSSSRLMRTIQYNGFSGFRQQVNALLV